MGKSYQETGFSEQRSYTSVSMKSPIYIVVYCILSFILGTAVASPIAETKTNHRTLKLCNQKPLECKFKYDILMYNETGRVPYQNAPTQLNTKNTPKGQ